MANVAVAAPVAIPASLDAPARRLDAAAENGATGARVEQLATQEEALEALAQPNHDPHVLPSFETRATSPILYLPPLLSSLPLDVGDAHSPAPFPAFSSPSAPRPLSTESRLPSIDQASLALHRALHHFRPVTEEYAKTPYPDAFNWSELELPLEEEREWYCVVFRSRRRDGSDGEPLYEADKKAHEEAVQNGGLILYWYGTPHPETGLNLATCIWQSRTHAAAANSRPHHIRAMRLAAASYERYELERHRLRKVKGETRLRIEPYDGGDVGW
ncbi:hypothetical protein C2E23DRAFT_863518 [Lenzites betulinus]|nr:hypothetical protein C2E23DRAFT_863518 [Lenzites betulinus]